MILRIYVGFDAREPLAYDMAIASANFHSSIPCDFIGLSVDRLSAYGLIHRPVDRRNNAAYDLVSNAPQSTDFAITRFLVPHLCQSGWALFVDADVVFLSDPLELFNLADPRKAVMVVKHPQLTTEGTKMDGQLQQFYARKNWSSVILWNCDHPANRRLTLHDINHRPGRDLHAFYWLSDDEIGELPDEWNWLVNVREKPADPKLAHFTLGGPFTPGWKGAPYDDIWLKARR